MMCEYSKSQVMVEIKLTYVTVNVSLIERKEK